MIFRRYEIRARSLLTGKDLVTGLPWEKYFFRRNAEQGCRSGNMVRFVQGAKSFEFYVHDRREDV